MHFDDALYQGKADAGAFDILAQSLKQFEYKIMIFVCNADAIIGNEKAGFVIFLPGSNMNSG
jgi:hypothetical protein